MVVSSTSATIHELKCHSVQISIAECRSDNLKDDPSGPPARSEPPPLVARHRVALAGRVR